MTTDYWTYRPSKRPSVKQVTDWAEVYSDYNDRDWRGDGFCGEVTVYNGRPFPDFYKVVWIPRDRNKKKVTKLFYGETAWNDTERFVYDLGFRDFHGVL